MKHYLNLIPIANKINKKESRMTRFCIMLAVFLVTAVFGMADMEIRCQMMQAKREDGNWHYAFTAENDEQYEAVKELSCVEYCTRYDARNYRLDEGYTLGGKPVIICGFDQDMENILLDTKPMKGTFPSEEQEATISEFTAKNLGVTIGDTIEVSCPDGTTDQFVISGITENTALLNTKDVYGVSLNFESFRSHGSAKGNGSTIFTTVGKFYHPVKAADVIAETAGISRDELHENVKLLGLSGFSKDSFIVGLYITAAVLALLVIVAGILMIASTLNSNCARKTRFYGMLRCLGATKEQVKRYVLLEAMEWCKSAIPIGVIAGSAIVCMLCIVLKLLSPEYFSDMPVLSISPIGIVSGVVVGIATVFIAALVPARRSSKVSPLTAISGNAEPIVKKNRKIRLWNIPIDLRLGLHHAAGNRKNYILMVLSFALSIILFLIFSITVDFFHHALKPVRPYTPDLTVTTEDYQAEIDKGLVDEIAQIPGVKKAYGRSAWLERPATITGDNKSQDTVINVISFDEQQFAYMKRRVSSGSLNDVINGTAVAVVFHEGSNVHVGDRITVETDQGTKELMVGAILTDSPFELEEGQENVICSETVFEQLTGIHQYMLIDIQLTREHQDATVEAIRNTIPESYRLSNQLLVNQNVRGAYYAMGLFMYGFVTVIAMISVFQIINSIGMSVNSRREQYCSMRAIGTDTGQLSRMITTEAVTYAVSGVVTGCLLGIPLHKRMFQNMISEKWGDVWQFPVVELLIILAVMAVALLIAVIKPVQEMKQCSVLEIERE